jgi:hypothetical protein
VAYAGEHHEELREARLLRGANAEICRDRGDDVRLVGFEERGKSIQAIAARRT